MNPFLMMLLASRFGGLGGQGYGYQNPFAQIFSPWNFGSGAWQQHFHPVPFQGFSPPMGPMTAPAQPFTQPPTPAYTPQPYNAPPMGPMTAPVQPFNPIQPPASYSQPPGVPQASPNGTINPFMQRPGF